MIWLYHGIIVCTMVVPQGIVFYHGILLWYVLRYYGKISAHHGTSTTMVYQCTPWYTLVVPWYFLSRDSFEEKVHLSRQNPDYTYAVKRVNCD